MFCLECVEEWRSFGVEKTEEQIRYARACPLCRIESTVVIPSACVPFLTARLPARLTSLDSEFIVNGPAKDAARTKYLGMYSTSPVRELWLTRRGPAMLSRTPCPDFLNSPTYARHCPLGTDCLYHHATSADLPAHRFLHSFVDTLRERSLARERREIEDAVRREVQRLEQQHGPQINANEIRRLYEQFRMAIPARLQPWVPPPGHALAPAAEPEADALYPDDESSEFDESESEDEDWESENEHGDDEDDNAAPAPRVRAVVPPLPPRPEIPNLMRRPIHPRARPQPPPPPAPPAPDVSPESDADDMPELEPIDSDGEGADSSGEGMPQLEDIDASDDDDVPPGVYATDSDDESSEDGGGLPPLETESSDESSDDDLPPPLVEIEPPVDAAAPAPAPVPAPAPLFAAAPIYGQAVDLPPLAPVAVLEALAAPAGRVRDPEMDEARERAARAAEARVVVARWEDVD